jgi:hypothetical protein
VLHQALMCCHTLTCSTVAAVPLRARTDELLWRRRGAIVVTAIMPYAAVCIMVFRRARAASYYLVRIAQHPCVDFFWLNITLELTHERICCSAAWHLRIRCFGSQPHVDITREHGCCSWTICYERLPAPELQA